MRVGSCLLLSTTLLLSLTAMGAGQNQNENQAHKSSGAKHPSGGGSGGGHHKPGYEHVAAIKKCNDDYKAAIKDAKTKKGKERSAAIAEVKASKKQCVANAPK